MVSSGARGKLAPSLGELGRRYRVAHLASGFSQSGFGTGAAHFCLRHDERHGDSTTGGGEELARGLTIEVGGLFENTDAAFEEFCVLRAEVDHQVAVDVAEASHGSGGEHVQNHLLRGAGFHAGGAGDNFRTDFGEDGYVRGFA
jgi:hypothetical protein